MPTYAYHCRACDNDFEVKQSFNDAPLADCIICNTPKSVFRVIQPAQVVFKGSGWYVTDHRSSSKANGSAKAAQSSTSSDKAEGGSTAEKSSSESTSTPAEKTSAPAKSEDK